MNQATLRLDAFLPYRLSVTSNLVSERIAGTYQALFGLTIAEWRLIAVIAEQTALTQQALSDRTRMDKVTVSRAAIALVQRGLVQRSPNGKDKRSHLLSLTPAGQEVYAAVVPRAKALEREVFACLTEAERQALADILNKVERGLT